MFKTTATTKARTTIAKAIKFLLLSEQSQKKVQKTPDQLQIKHLCTGKANLMRQRPHDHDTYYEIMNNPRLRYLPRHRHVWIVPTYFVLHAPFFIHAYWWTVSKQKGQK